MIRATTALSLVALALAALAGCDDEASFTASDDLAARTGPGHKSSYVAHARLLGEDEVPPVDTVARGNVILREGQDGELHFRILVTRIEDVVAAHIHCGEEGENGPVGVTLFSEPQGVTVRGPLASGTIEAPDADNACGWQDIGDILDAIEAGDAYVNVHTVEHASGEIRGQL